jgi:hypothetical protein
MVKVPGYRVCVWGRPGFKSSVVTFFLHVFTTCAGYIAHYLPYIESFPN